jgi:hypothetical protein
MANEQQKDEDFDLGFTPEAWAGIAAWDGVDGALINVGHYRWRISKTAPESTKKADKPHVMMKVTFQIVHAYDEKNKDMVGLTIDGRYAGSKESPEVMQKRLKSLAEAAKVQPTKQGIKASAFVGREIDASITWELSQDNSKFDPMTGKPKMYVNARLKAERQVGAALPAGFDPIFDSRAAVAYREKGESGASAPEGDAAPWAAAPATPAAASTEAPPADLIKETDDGTVHGYRAVVALNGEDAQQAREALLAAGYDPEGPIDPELIADAEIKAAYAKAMAPAPAATAPKLAPLGNGAKARTGARAPALTR